MKKNQMKYNLSLKLAMGRLFHCLLFALVLLSLQSYSQKKKYTTANAHSHNDYEQAMPFWNAWKAGFGSVEADVFLVNGKLIVAHDTIELKKGRTLDSLYLRPLEQCIRSNSGKVYPDSRRSLQLMIDIKSEAASTLQTLIETMKQFPLLTGTRSLTITISGNRPLPAQFASYPVWLQFDGELGKEYTVKELKRIPMLSGNFKNFSSWNGKEKMAEKDSVAVQALIQQAHKQHQKIRFWNAPDNPTAWDTFRKMGVDYLNTDRISEIGSWFQGLTGMAIPNQFEYLQQLAFLLYGEPLQYANKAASGCQRHYLRSLPLYN